MALPGERTAAVLTIRDSEIMTTEGKHAIAAWLREQARTLLKDGANYAPLYRARYLVHQQAEVPQ